MGILVLLIIIVIVMILFFSSIDWFTHLEMTCGDSDINGWGSYKKFKIEFEKYGWQIGYIDTDKSIWNRINDCKFHANIIKFNGIGMKLLTPIDLILAKKFVKRWIKNNYPDTKKNSKNYKW